MLDVIIPARALPSRRQVPIVPGGTLLMSETRSWETERHSLGGAKEEGHMSLQEVLQFFESRQAGSAAASVSDITFSPWQRTKTSLSFLQGSHKGLHGLDGWCTALSLLSV